jgi:hypothetical protein
MFWLYVHLFISAAHALFRFATIFVLRNNYQYRALYSIIITVIFNLAMVTWLIYGNMLYFAEDNDCAISAETVGMNNFMFFLIVLGYFHIIFVALLIFVLPILIFMIHNKKRDELS